MKVIDLTHAISENMPVFPGTEEPILAKANTIEKDGFKEAKLTMYSHTGTHIDAPAHMLENGATLDELNINHFIGKAFILDFQNRDKKFIEIENLNKHEKKLNEVDFLILKTGWSKYWGKDKYFDNFPSLSPEASKWLTEFNLKGVGVDAISIDDMKSTTFNVHLTLMRSNMIIIENLTNLDAINDDIFTLSVLPLKTKDADGSPVRAIAIEEE